MEKIRDFLLVAFSSYERDPAKSDYQRGYLAALINVRDQFFSPAEIPLAESVSRQTECP